MTDQIKIKGLSIVDQRPNKAGNTIIAFFDCEARGMLLRQCALMRTAKGGLSASPPRVELSSRRCNGVWFMDCALSHAVMDAARTVYIAMGGTMAEWIKHEDWRALPDGVDGEDDSSGLRRVLGADAINETLAQAGI
ncbi:hypothetical protein VQ045_02135 [Aurantimonas sp. E1-2-R+4]|uniref:hypothetical protein n=1 Tax=Aurantimonas sp. E1-2-R+4 TaxID=3113714 RepID=UPI002F92E22D